MSRWWALWDLIRRKRLDLRWIAQTRAFLRQSDRAMESVFLRLGDQLEPLTGKMEDLIRARDNLVSYSSGQIEGKTIFEEAVNILHEPLQHIELLVTRKDELRDLLRRCEQQTGEMLASQRSMKSLLAPLAYVEVLFKIESANLSEENRDTFTSVAREIGHLRRLVDENFQENTQRLALTHATLREVREHYEKDMQVHAGLVEKVRVRVDSSISQLDRDLVRNTQMDSQTQQLAMELRKRVGDVVTALQMHDIVRQKNDHLEHLLEGMESARMVSPKVLSLARNQLSLVLSEVRRGAVQIDSGLHAVIDQAEQIERRSVEESGFDGMVASADGMVQMILDTMSETRVLLEDTNRLVDRSFTAARPAGEVLQSVSAAVGELSVQMRLIALNAQIRSAQITEDTGLSTLAAHTAKISTEIIHVSSQMAADIDGLRAATSSLFEILESFLEDGSQNVAKLEADGRPLEERLHGLRDQTLEVFNGLGETVGSIRDGTDDIFSAVSELRGAGEGLHKAHALIAAEEASLAESQMSVHRARKVEEDLLEGGSKRYSMASERQVHNATLNGGSIAAVAPMVTEVDLFGDPEDFAEVDAATFETEDLTPKSNSEPDSPLSDNIELF